MIKFNFQCLSKTFVEKKSSTSTVNLCMVKFCLYYFSLTIPGIIDPVSPLGPVKLRRKLPADRTILTPTRPAAARLRPESRRYAPPAAWLAWAPEPPEGNWFPDRFYQYCMQACSTTAVLEDKEWRIFFI